MTGDSYTLVLPEQEMPATFKRATIAEVAPLLCPLIPDTITRYPLACAHEYCPEELGFLYDLEVTTWPYQGGDEGVPCVFGGVFIAAGTKFDMTKFRCQAVEEDGKVVSFRALAH